MRLHAAGLSGFIVYRELPTKRPALTVCSIDPAVNNYAIRIEKRTSRSVVTLLQEKWTIGKEPGVFSTLTAKLNGIRHLLEECDVILIERQPPINYKAAKIEQHTISYGLLTLSACVISCSTLTVRKTLGIKGKPGSIAYALRLLESNGDFSTLALLRKEKKKDDHCDTICQCEAFSLSYDLISEGPKVRVIRE